jgi:hypothetical protein
LREKKVVQFIYENPKLEKQLGEFGHGIDPCVAIAPWDVLRLQIVNDMVFGRDRMRFVA